GIDKNGALANSQILIAFDEGRIVHVEARSGKLSAGGAALKEEAGQSDDVSVAAAADRVTELPRHENGRAVGEGQTTVDAAQGNKGLFAPMAADSRGAARTT